ncbi:MAG: DNA adenine methylase [Candidatus Dojkabacteria bacterium]|nr:MAG: DNA adenine methylase [Candidatus Dojkabacteria bacterium]
MNIFRYVGGKSHLIDVLLKLVPPGGRPYCEPYAGAANLFWRRAPAPIEVLNDTDKNIYTLYFVLRNSELREKFIEMVHLTPYSREFFKEAIGVLETTDDPVERAWAFYYLANSSFGGKVNNVTPGNWGRSMVRNQPITWFNKINNLDKIIKRLSNAYIDCIDGIKCIEYWDNESAVFYVDPPYHPDSVSWKNFSRYYSNYPDHDYHVKLANTLLQCKGAVVLSGYDNPAYKILEDNGWIKLKYDSIAYLAGTTKDNKQYGRISEREKREECIWLNHKIEHYKMALFNKQ